jgi:hypothetical protein
MPCDAFRIVFVLQRSFFRWSCLREKLHFFEVRHREKRKIHFVEIFDTWKASKINVLKKVKTDDVTNPATKEKKFGWELGTKENFLFTWNKRKKNLFLWAVWEVFGVFYRGKDCLQVNFFKTEIPKKFLTPSFIEQHLKFLFLSKKVFPKRANVDEKRSAFASPKKANKIFLATFWEKLSVDPQWHFSSVEKISA